MNKIGDGVVNIFSWGFTLLATISPQSVLIACSLVVSLLSIAKLSLELFDWFARRRRKRRDGGYSTADEDEQEDNDQ